MNFKRSNDAISNELEEYFSLSSNGLYSSLAKSAVQNDWFFFWGEVSDASCEICAMFLMDAVHKKKPMITISLCSGGGEESYTRALLGIMEYCKKQGLIIRGYGLGEIASAAFDILSACSKGYRFAFEATMFMTHSSSGHVEDEDMYELQKKLDAWTLREYTNIHAATRKRFLKTGNWWFDPNTAVQYGAIDGVVKVGEDLPSTPVFPERKTVEQQKREAKMAEHSNDDEDEE